MEGAVMTAEQVEHFRRRLEEQRAALELRVARARERGREPRGEEPLDAGDESVRDILVDTELEVGDLRTREREEIDDALLRIERGEYGRCEVCGRPIEIDRLEAEPSARLCKDDARRATFERRPKM